jgi:single-strand DNA-binding protein
MASFNQATLLGNVTRDPEQRFLPNQTAVTEFGIACNRKWKDATGAEREEVMFIDCTAFGKPAEILSQYVQKGHLLFVQGRIVLDQWEDKNGGGKRSKHKLVVENFQLMPRRDGGEGAPGGQQQAAPTRTAGPTPPIRRPMPARPAPAQQPAGDIVDDDIPW